jgi:hypothetical protein
LKEDERNNGIQNKILNDDFKELINEKIDFRKSRIKISTRDIKPDRM